MKKALIVLLAVAFVGAFALPAMAADKTEWSFYGDARVSTMVYDTDENAANAPNGPLFDDRDTMWHLQDGSRFGARASAGDITGHVEIRESAEFRHIFGEWDWGIGKLGVGKTYTPVNMFYAGQAGFNGNGIVTTGVFTNADGMIRLRFDELPGPLDFITFALVEPANLDEDGAGEDVPILIGSDADNTLPQIEMDLVMKFGGLRLEMNGGWAEVEDTRIVGNAEREYDIDAWQVAFGAMYSIGPFYANGLIHTGENVTQLGQFTWAPASNSAWYNAATDSIVDSDRWGFNLVAGFKVNEMFAMEAGYGQDEADTNAVGAFEDETSEWYVQFPITPAKGVLIMPEIGELDYENGVNNQDQGDEMYYGVYWKIAF